MPTDVIMPQMGESIFEGTLTKWLKKPGDKVSRDEPLFEISTDKVDAEIPSPAAGVLVEQKVAQQIYASHLNGTSRLGNVLWSLLVLAKWAERYHGARANSPSVQARTKMIDSSNE